MPKSAVINLSFENEAEQALLKRLSLFFDDIYVEEFAFKYAKHALPLLDNVEANVTAQEVEWLIDKGIVKTYNLDRNKIRMVQFDNNLLTDIKETEKLIHENTVYTDEYLSQKHNGTLDTSQELQFVGALKITKQVKENMEDIRTRVRCLLLSTDDASKQFIPILNSFDTYTSKRNENTALHFVLSMVPMPSADTSWEQLIDFRSDEDVRRKYYALINWVNEMSSSNMPLSHIVDKYNYLYSEYSKLYRLHKMKSNFTTVELLALGGIEFISLLANHDYVAAFKSLLNIGKQNIALMEQEQKITGREIAYLHSANQRFLP